MSRVIKFRAWDRIAKRMIYQDDNKLCKFFSDMSLISSYGEDTINPDVELMQFTGLKDSKGVEIYEGDRLECEIGNNEIVEFKNASFICRYRTISLYDLCMQMGFEVIGNIHERSET